MTDTAGIMVSGQDEFAIVLARTDCHLLLSDSSAQNSLGKET